MVYERVRSYLQSNGIRFHFVADKAGISRDRFYRLMDGRSPLKVDEYEIICRAGLSLHPGYFFDE